MSPVVFVTVEDLSKITGSGVATRELIRAVGTLSEEPLFVLCPEPADELPDRLQERVDEFRFLPPETNPGAPLWHAKEELRILQHLWQLLRKEDPSAVLMRLSPSTLFPAPLCRLYDVPYVLLIRGWVNRDDKYDSTKFGDLVEQIVRMNVRLSNDVYVAFDELRGWVEPYRGREQSSVEVLPNAVDPEMFSPMPIPEAREKLGLKKDRFIIGFVGSLAIRHELPTLLQAVAQLESVYVLIVGAGELGSDLERLVMDLGIEERVTFTGKVAHEKVPVYIAACDVTYGVVNPDRVSNPIKCYEYLACQRPVITSQTPEMGFLKKIEAGVIIKEVNKRRVASAIEDLHANSREERKDRGQRGREYIKKNYTWRNVARAILPRNVKISE